MRKYNSPETASEEWVFLIGCRDDQEANMLESFLKAESIFVLRKYGGAGDYLKVACGMTIFGIDLYVRNYQYETAQEILDQLTAETETTDGTDRAKIIDITSKKSAGQEADCKIGENKVRWSGTAVQNKIKKRFIFIAGLIIIYFLGSLLLHYKVLD